MREFKTLDNPFAVQSPEDMSVEDAVALFVDVFSDFPKIPHPGHTFLHGPRGCGKSMMFRYLLPDCQSVKGDCRLADLPFFSVWIRLRNTDLKLTELRRLDDDAADVLLNEHFFTIHIAERVFDSLRRLALRENTVIKSLDEITVFARECFEPLLRSCGWTGSVSSAKLDSATVCFESMQAVCDGLFKDVLRYLEKISFRTDMVPYDSALCGYLSFLFPLLCGLRDLSFMPSAPLFLLIDDADNLNLTQTRVLNTWVSTRTSAQVSIKISTQLAYKTYRTVTGRSIDTPHDFSEINISTVYTTSAKNKYVERVHDIVRRRLGLFGYPSTITPRAFFPPNADQERAIERIGESRKERWEQNGRGYRQSDDSYRYARPDFMRGLAGRSKSSASYQYAGFEQLVHLSSGIIRFFLDAAAQMYGTFVAQKGDRPSCIPSGIQDQITRESADDFLFTEFARIEGDLQAPAQEKELLEQLFNLIKALGGTFRQILLSDRSERRVFSVAFSDTPPADIVRVLRMGVSYGYFHESTIGNKSGTGRTRLYVLSRRLAPHFNLDPTSFAGYLFVTSDSIRQAMDNPDGFLRRIKKRGIDSVFEERQLAMFS